MNISLSGGPILEPLIGLSIASLISVFLLIYFIKITIKSEFYQNQFYDLNNSKKILLVISYLAILSCLMFVLFFILAFLASGLVFLFEKWF